MITAWRRAARRVPDGTAAAVTHGIFVFLIIVEVVRSWHHAMFRASPRLAATPLKTFDNASSDENFWIYRMSAQP